MASTLSVSTGFNEENFLKKLDNVTPTQDSIQSLALWIIHHKINHEAICRLWLKKLNDASSGKQRLALFYLANDVIQNCKRKNAKIFQDTFKSWLIEAVELVKNDAIKKKIERVFDVWSERNVYDHEFIVKLNETLYKEDTIIKQSMLTKSPILADKPGISVTASKSPPSTILLNHQQSSDHENKNETEYQKIITEFQPKKLRESINSFYSLQNEVNLAKTNVEATRLLDINVEHIKQYRDKNQCAKFKVEFENSCNKLEEFIHKLTQETEQRKLLIQLLKQSEIFYDAQFKDATTVYNAYKSYGYKVSTVKRKLDELIAHKFSPNDVKLDNLDMEMSDEDETDDLKSKTNHHHYSKQSFSKTRSPPHLSTSSLASSSNASIRNNLDPRQNRHSSHHSSTSNNSKKTSISSSSSSKINLNNPNPKRKTADDNEDDLNLQHTSRDRSNTPVKDENSPNKPSTTNNSNPLDFLTKFINKSAGNDLPAANSPTTAVSTNSSTGGSSANLSYLVDSLKKFVNTSTTTPGTAASYVENTNSTSFMSQQGVTQFYDHPLNSQNTFIQPRSATPTKDEIYQPRIDQTKTIQSMPPLPPLPPPLPPLPMDSMQQPPPGPHSPYIPPFHPMMYQQNPPNQIYNNFAFAPPPPPPPNLPPPNMLMMIDPNNCYQYPPTVATNNNKMMISPPLSSTSTGSSSSANQANSPTNQSQSYWANGFNPNHVEETSANNGSYNDDNQMRITKFNGNNNNNDYSSPYKRKFNNNGNKYYNEDNNRGHYNNKNNKNFNNNNNNNNNKVQQNQFNRIPTISSNRSTNESNNNNNSNNQNKWGANGGPKANRF